MQTIKIQCPAKINLNLKITGELEGGFHAIESVMQTISLYDYLTITVEDSGKNEIILSGNSTEITYDETNLVYKAVKLYLDTAGITDKKINVYIEKNIPVSAGLAGGSTDGAGVLYGLDKIFRKDEILRGKIFRHSEQSAESENFAPLNDESYIDKLCAKLGSDLNVCLRGGRVLAQGRGEIITPLEFEDFNVSLIKPINLSISAKEAYTKFSQKKQYRHPELDSGSVNFINHNFKENLKILKQVQNDKFSLNDIKNREGYVNDLEWAIIEDYKELQHIKQKYPKSIMTGSGSTYFMIDEEFEKESGYWVKNGLKAVNFGVKEV